MEESQNIEYKESWRDEYLRWICGFANAQGGTLYIGINDNKEVVGIADEVLRVLRSKYLIAPIRYEGMVRKEPLEIPESSLREAIYNAIVHKDYTGVAIQMKVWNDRIELWNDGNLPDKYYSPYN